MDQEAQREYEASERQAMEAERRADEADFDEDDGANAPASFGMQDALKAGGKEAFKVVRDAVENASKGEEPLTVGELAYAIAVGLFPWAGDHKKTITEVAVALLDQTGEPYDVHNRAEEHRDEEPKPHPLGYLTCRDCKKAKKSVHVRSCGYQSDVNNNKSYRHTVCDECEREHCADI